MEFEMISSSCYFSPRGGILSPKLESEWKIPWLLCSKEDGKRNKETTSGPRYEKFCSSCSWHARLSFSVRICIWYPYTVLTDNLPPRDYGEVTLKTLLNIFSWVNILVISLNDQTHKWNCSYIESLRALQSIILIPHMALDQWDIDQKIH